eukprot:m.182583 g.182583  ORF g.182583 m.182583 type:complete len:340 (-) comp15528_c0_seq8:1681-2700(-)
MTAKSIGLEYMPWVHFTAKNADGTLVQLMIKGLARSTQAHGKPSVEFKLMVSDLSTIWSHAGEAANVLEHLNGPQSKRYNTVVEVAADRLLEILCKAFSEPSKVKGRWVVKFTDKSRFERDLHLELVDRSRTSAVRWEFDCLQEERDCFQTHISRPICMIVSELRRQCAELRDIVRAKDEEISKHVLNGSSVPEPQQTQPLSQDSNCASDSFPTKSMPSGQTLVREASSDPTRILTSSDDFADMYAKAVQRYADLQTAKLAFESQSSNNDIPQDDMDDAGEANSSQGDMVDKELEEQERIEKNKKLIEERLEKERIKAEKKKAKGALGNKKKKKRAGGL